MASKKKKAAKGAAGAVAAGQAVASNPYITRLIEDRTDWSIKKFVQTTRRYRTVQIHAGKQLLTATDPLPRDLRDALALIN